MSASSTNPPASFADLCESMAVALQQLPEGCNFFLREEPGQLFKGMFRFVVEDFRGITLRRHFSRMIKKDASQHELRCVIGDLVYITNR